MLYSGCGILAGRIMRGDEQIAIQSDLTDAMIRRPDEIVRPKP
jgi:hypothetical protein